ncbi:DUF2237 domain-containing protein [Scytonema sp. NUACC21]
MTKKTSYEIVAIARFKTSCGKGADIANLVEKSDKSVAIMTEAKNVLGEPLEICCTSPMTGYYRDGKCNTGGGDFGVHVVCAQVTEEFLAYTKSRGNDLSTPVPAFNFPGLKPGDRWCLCASRWQEALEAGVAPPVVLSATHASALEHVSLDDLKQHAVQ